jgi:hypothetical protein
MAKERKITRQSRQHPNSVSARPASISGLNREKKQKFPNEPNFPQATLLNTIRNSSKPGCEKSQN